MHLFCLFILFIGQIAKQLNQNSYHEEEGMSLDEDKEHPNNQRLGFDVCIKKMFYNIAWKVFHALID